MRHEMKFIVASDRRVIFHLLTYWWSWKYAEWRKSQLTQNVLSYYRECSELNLTICRTVSQHCELCIEHEGSHFEHFLAFFPYFEKKIE
jgi:hypothetical protein